MSKDICINLPLQILKLENEIALPAQLSIIAILTIFFTQVNATFRPKHIFMGQYLDFTFLIALS